ncbi:MAG: YdcF family protein [Chitinophagaceae bacterium]|nr:YdcF family protein [Chitinophagaceae bacterium]
MIRRLLKPILIATALLIAAVLFIDYHVFHSVKSQSYNDTEDVPYNRVGLLLGTSKYVKGGRVNLFYKYRIDAAVRLYKAHKIDFIIVSGDNGTKSYNEPQTMKKDLIAQGIPEEKIYLDYAGFRTLDSVVRCKAIFGAEHVTIISQRFHNERALYIANNKGLKAVAYNADDPPKKWRIKVLIREKLARTKMFLDLLFNKQPKFYGPAIQIQ